MDVAKSDKFDSSGGGGSNCENGRIKKSPHSKNMNGATGYLTANTRQAFTQLREIFTKALILQHFDPKCYIHIGTGAL